MDDRDRLRRRWPRTTRPWWRRPQVWIGAAAVASVVVAVIAWYWVTTTRAAERALDRTGTLIVNINTASADELDTIPGIGSARAALIIAGRPYQSIDELARLDGIGINQVESMRPFITVEGPTRELQPPDQSAAAVTE